MGNATSTSDSDDEVVLNEKTEDVGAEAEVHHETESVPLLDMSLLFDITSLRSMASKILEVLPENALQKHQEYLVRWLEEKLQRNEETVTLSQFYDVLLNKSVDRNECRQIFQQFDADGEGFADVKLILDFLKKSNVASQFVELSTINGTFQSCSYAPGFIDIYNEDKESIGHHALCLFRFLIRNRAPISALPYLTLNNFNNMVNMRMLVFKDHFTNFKKSSNTTGGEKDNDVSLCCSRTEVLSISKCVASYEVSSNKADAHRLFSNETSYWQSDGSARSHWIRIRIKNNIIIKHLSIGVLSSDQSYMPQHVTVLVGRHTSDLHEIKELKIPSHSTGDLVLLENVKTYYPVIQINIKRCHNEGCDTRIHGIKMQGYKPTKESGVTTTDAAATWFLQVLSETATACLPMVPHLRTSILDCTRNALGYMPPLSLSPASAERPVYLSSHVLKEVDTFLCKMAYGTDGKVSKDGLDVLLSFSLAQGHLVCALKTLMIIKEVTVEEMDLYRLIHSMNSVMHTFWKKHGQQLEMNVVGCDGGQKDDTSGPSNVLCTPWTTSQPYLSADGKTKVNMFFRGSDRVQLTRLRIKVDKGCKGPRSGLIFVYNQDGEFNLEDHIKRFEFADGWNQWDSNVANQMREAGRSDRPVAHFEVGDDWDEIEVTMDVCSVGQYVLVKFLQPRNSSAERLGIIGMKFFGFDRKSSLMGHLYDDTSLRDNVNLSDSNTSTTDISSTASFQRVVRCVLSFFVSLVRDQCKPGSVPAQNRMQMLNLSDISMKILWDFFTTVRDSPVESGLVLQLLHALFPYLVHAKEKNQESTEAFFQYLCYFVDNNNGANAVAEQTLFQLAKEVITDGAAVFFPDKEARSKQLFRLIKDISDTNDAPSVTLTFQSLCQFFSNVDPSALLDLPPSPPDNYETSSVLRVMETLVSVAHRECLTLMETIVESEKSSHLVYLLCSLQTNLLIWCNCQLDRSSSSSSPDSNRKTDLAEGVLKSYVALVTSKLTSAFRSYVQCTDGQMALLMEKLRKSFLYSTFSQLIVILGHLCNYITLQTRTELLAHLIPIFKELQGTSLRLPHHFHRVDSTYWRRMEKDEEILRVWEIESNHNYENNQNIAQMFSCPSASSFYVEFDPRCETERRYDYLEFTDTRGSKTRFDHKVNADKWPLNVTFKGSRLHFLFRSDSSNNEWGYKFKVTAKGSSDVPVCWMFDAFLSLTKLIGRFCGANLDNTKVFPNCETLDGAEDVELEIMKSDLWKTLFRSGCQPSLHRQMESGLYASDVSILTSNFILSLLDESNGEGGKNLIQKCQEHHFLSGQNLRIGGATIDTVIVHVFVTLLWHTQSLQEDVETYISMKDDGKVLDGILQAYSAAESLRSSLFKTNVKNRQISKSITRDVSLEPGSFDALENMKEKAKFLLRFPGMSKITSKLETKTKLDRKSNKVFNRVSSINSEKGTLKTDSAFDKHPSFRIILDFLQDPAWSTERVEHILKERKLQAEATTNTYLYLVDFLQIISESDGSIFKVPLVLLFQELLQYQDKFASHYADGLDGCGVEQETKLRNSFYSFVRYLVKSVDETSKKGLLRRLMCNDFIEACTLHFLDVNWQIQDLSLLEELKIPDLLYNLTVASLSVHEEQPMSTDSESELEDYKTNMMWLEECKKSGFTQWNEKHKKGDKKTVQMFIARYRDVLEVEIICDGCGASLPGGRYRCLECVDVDLCSTCYADGRVPVGGHSVSHDLIHFLYRCDGCQGFILGTRIHCNVCEDFDLCFNCHNVSHFPSQQHKQEHSYVVVEGSKLSLIRATHSVIRSYIHNHVWLLYSSLALSVTGILYSRHQEALDCDHVQAAIQIYNRFIQISTKCFMQTPISTSQLTNGDEEELHLRTLQEETFVAHSQEKIMGLLGAMIPPANKTLLAEDVSQTFISEEFINMLFSIARGERGRESSTQHFALGLIGQLLQRIPTSCKVVDFALGLSSDSSESESSLPSEDVKPKGYKTTQYLFDFGASCLERNGLEWASTMALILQKLFNAPAWHYLLATFLSDSVSKLRKGSSLTSIFALYVLAGFPEVLSLGSLVKYSDSATDVKYGIVIKHFSDKNRTLIIDRLTRRRKTLKDVCVEVVDYNNCFVGDVHVIAFTHVIKDSVRTMKQGGVLSVENSWTLSLVLKALLKSSHGNDAGEEKLSKLFEAEFIQCIVYLAGLGTGFSKQWLLSDLEILSLMMYTKDDSKTSEDRIEREEEQEEKAETNVNSLDNNNPETVTCSSDESTCDPLEDLDMLARQTFHTLNGGLNVPMSILRAIYEMHGCSTDALLLAVHENVRNDSFIPSEEILKMSKKWEEPPAPTSAELEADKAIDIGLQSPISSVKEKKDFDGLVTEEPVSESQRLITTVDGNIKATIVKQRHRTSSALLRKELEKKRDNSNEFLVKVNNALAVLYARQVLTALLADRSTSRHIIASELMGSRVEADLPYVLDLLNRPESQEVFQKIVENVIAHCRPEEGLVAIAFISCDFIEEVCPTTVTKELARDPTAAAASSSDKEPIHVQDRVHIPGAVYVGIQFDNRCYTDDEYTKLTMSSSEDFKQDKRVFTGRSHKWSDFEMPGDVLYFKFLSDPTTDWFYKFTVVGGRFGRFDTGYRILNGLLRTNSIVHLLPLNEIWCSLIRVSCRQIGQRRLKSVQLLLLLLHSQFKSSNCSKLSLDLGMLRPLWRLHRKMTDSVQDSVCILPPLVLALTELFFFAENLALDWEITENYVVNLIDDEDIHKMIYQGVETIAALSHSIAYKNKATEMFSITNVVRHVVSADRNKVCRALMPQTVINC